MATPETSTTNLEQEEGEDYLPLFLASALAALVTLASQVSSSVYLAVQQGLPITLDWWNRLLPVFAIRANPIRFYQLVEHSSLITAVVLGFVGTQAVVRRQRLQVQAGYAFAWLDMALIGAVQLIGARWFDSGPDPDLWMVGLLVTGLVGFVVIATLIYIDFADREAGAVDESERLSGAGLAGTR